MGHFNKIKLLSIKLAVLLIKSESSSDIEKPESFDEKTKAQMLSDIKKGKYLNLLKEIDTEKDWKILKRKLQCSRRSSCPSLSYWQTGSRREFWTYSVAASVVLFISITFVFKKTNQDTDFSVPTIINNNIEIGADKAILTLEDGSEVVLEKGTSFQIENPTSNGEELVYLLIVRQALAAEQVGGKSVNNPQQTNNHISYKTLTIPRGGQFFIYLSDGIKVWLNSESQLKYPVTFTDDETRQVELVYGEAYFEVSPSTNYKGSKFKVFQNSQEIEVFWTEFNIKAYKGETNIYTTLVEDKVNVSSKATNQLLTPDQQSNLDIQSNKMVVSTVDVSSIISWKDGIFDFENKPLKDIMKVLSSWYDMDVVIENKDLENEKLIGSFNKRLPIKDIFASIKNTNIINNYEINNKTISIKLG